MHLKALLTVHLVELFKVVRQDATVQAAYFVFRIFEIHCASYETRLGPSGRANYVRKYGENDTTVCGSNRTDGGVVFVFWGVYALP